MTIEQAVESLRGELVESVQHLVRLKSVKGEPKPGMPFGEDVDRCYRGFLQLAESLGFTTKDFDGYAGHAEIGEGDQVLGILGHVDTVPLGDGWDLDPCSGALVDGKIYGRGVMDDKGPTISCLYAVKALQLAGVPLTKKIRVIFGLDEESGWECMAHYLPLAGEPDCSFTPDGSFPVIYGEKGMCNYEFVGSFSGENPSGVSVLSIVGGNRPNMVPDRCTARMKGSMDLGKAAGGWAAATGEQIAVSRDGEEYVVEITGISAHGSNLCYGIHNCIRRSVIRRSLCQLRVKSVCHKSCCICFAVSYRKLCSHSRFRCQLILSAKRHKHCSCTYGAVKPFYKSFLGAAVEIL